MLGIQLKTWTKQNFFGPWTNIVMDVFSAPQQASYNMAGLFCYDRSRGIGSLFATVVKGILDNGTPVPDGPYLLGTVPLGTSWTIVVNGPNPFQVVLYDAASGTGAFYATDGRGGLTLVKQYTDWRTSWTQIVRGNFGRANLLFYDASSGTGEFYHVDSNGEMALISSDDGWRNSWQTIITGKFSDNPHDDLLFYDKAAGVIEFYQTNGNGGMNPLGHQDGLRQTWHVIASGFLVPGSTTAGLLFYEDTTGYTEFYTTDGNGGMSLVNSNPGSQWSNSWQAIFVGNCAPDFYGTDRLCAIDATQSEIVYFYPERYIPTVLDLNGRWFVDRAGGPAISVEVEGVVLTVDMSAYRRPAATGTILDSSTITVTFPDDRTYTGKLLGPNPIHEAIGFQGSIEWSNGSVWERSSPLLAHL